MPSQPDAWEREGQEHQRLSSEGRTLVLHGKCDLDEKDK